MFGGKLFDNIGKTKVLFPVAFLATMALGCTAFGIAFYAKDVLRAGPAVVGQFAGIWSLSYIIGCLSLDSLSRRLLPRWSLLLALSSMGLFLGALLTVQSIPLALVLFGAYGFSTSLFFPPLVGWLTAGVESAELGRTTSRFAIAWSVGSTVSPWLCSRLILVDRHAPLIFSVSLYALVGGFLLFANLRFPRIRGDFHKAAAPSAGLEIDNSTYLRFPAWVLVFVCYLMNSLIMNHWPVYMRDTLRIRTESIGAMFLLRSASLTLMFILLGKFVVWHFKRRMFVIASLLSMASALMLMFFSSEAALLAALMISALALGLAYNGSIFYAVAGARNRQKRTALNEVVLNAGTFSGAIGSGYLLEYFSMFTVMIFIVALLAIGLAAQARLLVRPPRALK